MAVAVFDINEQVAKAKAAELQARGAQAQALAFGVTVNCVAPGFVVSDMTKATAARIGRDWDEYPAERAAGIPVRRAGEPEAHDASGVHRLNFEFHRLLNEDASDVLRRFVVMTTRLVSRRTYPDVVGWSHSIDDRSLGYPRRAGGKKRHRGPGGNGKACRERWPGRPRRGDEPEGLEPAASVRDAHIQILTHFRVPLRSPRTARPR
jgi:hypothetical protein